MFFLRWITPFFRAFVSRLGPGLLGAAAVARLTGRPAPTQTTRERRVGQVLFLGLLLALLFVLLVKRL